MNKKEKYFKNFLQYLSACVGLQLLIYFWDVDIKKIGTVNFFVGLIIFASLLGIADWIENNKSEAKEK